VTSDFAALEDEFRAATAELDSVIAQARVDLARFERDNQPTAAELRELQEVAESGDLGFDMQELARRVDDGTDSWPAIFSGESPNSVLLQGHLARMIEENREAARVAIEEDDEFDPFPPPEDL
jgi:ABC-type transporter Mla subunit MlaD